MKKNDFFALAKNYLRTTLRTISKNKVYSALNIMGLALGIAACLFILQYVSYERSYDKFHSNHEDLYRVRYQIFREGKLEVDCAAAVPRVGPFMKEKMPEVVDYARAYPISGVVTYNNIQYWEKRMHIADRSFLEIFDFSLIAGDVASFDDPNTVIISESTAQKYFKGADPMGKTLEIDGEYRVEIVGVAKDVPDNSHIKFDLLISYETLNNQTRNDDGIAASETAWGWYDFNTYVLLRPGTVPEDFDARFREFLWEEQGERFKERNYHVDFPLQAITDIHLYSNLLQESEPEEQGDGDAVAFLLIIAFFILLIAWVNYINLSTARSIERAREVGVRKTLGATRGQLVYQFLAESFFLNLFALAIALGIVTLGIGAFNRLTDSSLNLAFLTDSIFWLSIAGILIVGSLIAGLYPAFVLSSYRPVAVLKGKMTGTMTGHFLRKGLVIFQFAASATLIASTIIVYQQLAHMRKIDLGFDMTETLVIRGPEVFAVDSLFESTSKAFKEELTKKASISNVAASSNVPGDEIFWTNGIKRQEESDDKYKIIYNAGVDYNYFETYKIDIVAGRNYGPEFTTDTAALVLNEAAVKYLGFQLNEEAVGQKVTFWGRPHTIVGVVADYNQMSAKTKVAPIAFPLTTGASNYYTLRLEGRNYQSVFNEVQATYQSFFPGNPFDYFFLDQFYNRQYDNDRKFSRVFTLFAGFAIFVACLGLFGLSSFNTLNRRKEIGIRKIMGASVPGIVQMLSREYLWLVLIANLLAWPTIYLLMNNWLDNFATRISLGVNVFIISALIVLFIALATVSYKIITTALANPVKAIRLE
ncbi:MAG: ABC transporter permease [Saprospiraceae bacterium]|nr:ABC transporter permease [Lewinella sp.]